MPTVRRATRDSVQKHHQLGMPSRRQRGLDGARGRCADQGQRDQQKKRGRNEPGKRRRRGDRPGRTHERRSPCPYGIELFVRIDGEHVGIGSGHPNRRHHAGAHRRQCATRRSDESHDGHTKHCQPSREACGTARGVPVQAAHQGPATLLRPRRLRDRRKQRPNAVCISTRELGLRERRGARRTQHARP